jgi:hypothetical protein
MNFSEGTSVIPDVLALEFRNISIWESSKLKNNLGFFYIAFTFVIDKHFRLESWSFYVDCNTVYAYSKLVQNIGVFDFV